MESIHRKGTYKITTPVAYLLHTLTTHEICSLPPTLTQVFRSEKGKEGAAHLPLVKLGQTRGDPYSPHTIQVNNSTACIRTPPPLHSTYIAHRKYPWCNPHPIFLMYYQHH